MEILRLQVETTNEGKQRARIEKQEQTERENKRERRLQRAKDLLKGVLTYMPRNQCDIPVYFGMTTRTLDENHIDADI